MTTLFRPPMLAPSLLLLVTAFVGCRYDGSSKLSTGKIEQSQNSLGEKSLQVFNGDEVGAKAPAFDAVGRVCIQNVNVNKAACDVAAGDSLCTGTLIAPRLVMTAAHCISEAPDRAAGDFQGALVDVNRLSFSLNHQSLNSQNDRQVKRIFRYETYVAAGLFELAPADPNAPPALPAADDPYNAGGGDLAILELNEPIYGLNIPKLWTGAFADLPSIEGGGLVPLDIVGYGLDETENVSNANYKRVGSVFFEKAFLGTELAPPSNTTDSLSDGILLIKPGVAGNIGCHGDSGGPLIQGASIVGVLSSGSPTNICAAMTYNRFISVRAYGGWIGAKIAELNPIPANLVLRTTPLPFEAGKCIPIDVITSKNDTSLGATPTWRNTLVAIGSSSENQFFSDSDCRVMLPNSQVTIEAASNQATVYFTAGLPGIVDIRAEDRTLGHTLAPVHLRLNSVSGTATKIMAVRREPVTPSEYFKEQDCVAFDFSNRVVGGAAVPMPLDYSLKLTTTPQIPPNRNVFFSDVNCDTPTTVAVIPSDKSFGTVYVKAETGLATSLTLNFRANSNTPGYGKPPASGSYGLSITNGIAARLIIEGVDGPPANGSCTGYGVSLLDSRNFAPTAGISSPLTVHLSIPSTFGDFFDSEEECAKPTSQSPVAVTTVTIGANKTSQVFFIKRKSKDQGTMTAATGSLTSATFIFSQVN